MVIHAARIEAQAKGWKSDIQESQTESQGEFTLRVDAKEVVLNCTVLDSKGGGLVNDLIKANFHVFEDKKPQAIVSFQHQDTPVSVGLLVDASGSM